MFTRKGLIANSTRSGLFGVLAALLALVLSACGGGGSGGSGSGVGGTGGGAVNYTLGGSISGLNGSGLALTLMGGSQSVFPTSGATSFTFPNALVSGTTYDVKVSASPAGLTCSVAKGSGTIGSANVSNVVVTCANAAYTLGGSIQGLAAAGLVLSEGFDNLSLASGATSFTFPTSIAAGSSYLVTVRTQPQGMTCTVAYGTGIISANITNVTVTCVVETVLYSFGTGVSGDGLSSRAGLIQDSQGNLYGTTSWGGANGGGTIFKLAPPSGAQTAWTETVLYSFGTNGSADALQPRAGLVQDTQGNLYGTTSGGGAYSSGTVFKLTPPTGAQTAWTEAVLYSFDNAVSANGSDPEAGVIQDSQGNLYGTTFFGGAFMVAQSAMAPSSSLRLPQGLRQLGPRQSCIPSAPTARQMASSLGGRDPGRPRESLWDDPIWWRKRQWDRLQACAPHGGAIGLGRDGPLFLH